MTQTLDKPAQSAPGNGDEQKARTALVPARLQYPGFVYEAFGIDKGSWKALVEAIFPNAQNVESVVLALSYCRARKLDVFKRNVHIVPIWDKNRSCLVDTIWPGIGELRTTAFRTGEYAGRDATVFGPDKTVRLGDADMTFPEWAQVTVYRMVKGQRVAFAGPQVWWIETYATVKRGTDTPNEMWATRPRGQIDKCGEAAALRAAFPEEVGTDFIADEVGHERVKHVDSKEVTQGSAKTLQSQLDESPTGAGAVSKETGEVQTDEQQSPPDEQQTQSSDDDQRQRAERKSNPAESETSGKGTGVDVLAEAIDQGVDSFKKSLHAKAKETNPGIAKSVFEGGYFKYVTKNGGKAENVEKQAWRNLWNAIASKTFNYDKGEIVAE